MATETPPSPTADAPSPADILPRRRVALMDVMILVAALAIGMVPARMLAGLIGWEWIHEMGGDIRSLSPMDWLGIALVDALFATCLAGPLSLALILLRCIRPIPEAARATAQPGILGLKVASGVLLLVLPASMISSVALGSFEWIEGPESIFMLYAPISMKLIAMILLAVYVTRRSSGRIARPADWVERSARWLCWYWIVVGLAMPVLH